MKRSILIFGITGELGSRMAKLAVEQGHKVYGVSRGTHTLPSADLTGVEMLTGDKLDRDFMQQCSKLPVDVVVDTKPLLESLQNIADFFGHVKNVFIVSSTGTFVPLQQLPADETHPWREENHVNFHGKISFDKRALELFEQGRLPVTIFRPTNIIGDGRIPLDLYGGRDVNFFKALKNSEPLELPDVRQILLQSVCNWDLAKAMTLALTTPNEIRGEIIILSAPYAIRLIDFLNLIKQRFNSTSEITWVDADEFQKKHPEHTGLPFLREHMCFSIDKARKLLNYEPDYTPEQGLRLSLDWCLENGVF